MFKALFLILAPSAAWERIAAARRGYVFILGTYLIPIIVLVTLAEGWRLEKWTVRQPRYEIERSFSSTEVIHYEILHAGMLLAMVLISALLLHVTAESFHGRRNFLLNFTLISYGYGPLFFFYLLNVVPKIHPAVPWVLGIAISVWVLYQGVPRVLKTDPTQAFGIYLSALFVIVLVSGLVRLLTALYLLGLINFNNSPLLRGIGKWLQPS